MEKCKRAPQRAFSLWAMRNFALFLHNWWDSFHKSVATSDLFTADMVRTFIRQEPSSTVANPNAWLTIVAGMFAGVGAVLPTGGQIGANALAGPSTIAAGAVSFLPSDPVEDPRFDDFAELGAVLGNMEIYVDEGLTQYFYSLYEKAPEGEARMALAYVLEEGTFAHQSSGRSDNEAAGTNMVTPLRAAIIAELWNAGYVGIIKWSDDHPVSKEWKFSPCFKDNSKQDMDHAVACVNDKNYLIVSSMPQNINPPRLSIERVPLTNLPFPFRTADTNALRRHVERPQEKRQVVARDRPGREDS